MLRSLLIKLPALLLAIAALALGHDAWAWVLAAMALGAGAVLLVWQLFHPNAKLWARTVSSAADSRAQVALTFDDGPDPDFTPQVLDILRERGVRAAFFVVGERAEQHPELLARAAREGHIIGNHSHSHGLDFHFKLWRAARRELDACDAVIERVIGHRPALFRSPQGFKNPALGDVLRERGKLCVGWQARGFDAIERRAEIIERRVLSAVRAGSVVLLHDGSGLNGTHDRSPTIEALPKIIDALRARGLSLVRLDELLDVDAYVTPKRL